MKLVTRFVLCVMLLTLMSVQVFAETDDITQLGSLYGDVPWDELRDIGVTGNVACGIDGDSLYVIDITNPGAPVYGSSLELPSSWRDLHVEDGKAFIATNVYENLYVFDISDPYNAVELGHSDTSPYWRRAYHVDVDGDIAVMSTLHTGTNKVQLLDISDPTNITELSLIDLTNSSFDYIGSTISGDYLFITNVRNVQFYNISDPTAPQFIYSYNHNDDNVLPPLCVNDTLYVIQDGSQIPIFEVSDDAMAHVVTHFAGDGEIIDAGYSDGAFYFQKADHLTVNWWEPGGFGERAVFDNIDLGCLAADGNILVGGIYDNVGMGIYNIENPQEPTIITNYAEEVDVRKFTRYNNNIALIPIGNELQIVRCMMDGSMTLLSKISFEEEIDPRICVYESSIYVTVGTDAREVDISDLSNPVLIDGYLPGQYIIHRFGTDGNRMIAYGNDQVKLLDMTGEWSELSAHFIQVPEDWVVGDDVVCFVDEYEDNVQIIFFDENELQYPEYVMGAGGDGTTGITYDNGKLYLSRSTQWIKRIDVQSAAVDYEFQFAGYVLDIDVHGDYLYLAGQREGISVLDVSGMWPSLVEQITLTDEQYVFDIDARQDSPMLMACCGTQFKTFNIDDYMDVENSSETVMPSEFSITKLYPNPFNPTMTATISLPQASDLKVVVFNALGQEVAVMANEKFAAGSHSFTFDGTDLTSGIYFLRATTTSSTQTAKVVLMK